MRDATKAVAGFALGALALLAAGCAATGGGGTRATDERDPTLRLAALVAEWRAARAVGNECLDTAASGPVDDCERIPAEIERLALDFPRQPAVLLGAATIAAETGRPVRAQTLLDSLFALSPSQPDGAVLRARIAVGEGNLRFARRLLREQVELAPDHAGLREAEAGVLYLDGDVAGAERGLDAAEALGAPPWRIAYHRGLLDEARGRPAAAAVWFRTALEGNPAFDPARARLAGIEAGGLR